MPGRATAQEQAPAATSPSDLDALKARAFEEAQTAKPDEAIRDYQSVLSIQPEWKEGWWNLATLQYSANRFADAKTSFLKVVGFAPSMGTAWSLLGLSEFETKDYSDSISHLQKAQSLGIDDEETKRVSEYHLGMLLVRNGDFHQARDLLLTNFGGSAMSPQVKFVLGLALLRVPLLPTEIDPSKEALIIAAGEIASAGDRALTMFPGLIASHPDVPYLHFAYGLALHNAGQDTEAQAQMREETKISPESPLPWLELSQLALKHGQTAESHSATAKADALHPAQQSTREQRIILRYAGGASATSSAETKENPELWNKAMQEYAARQYEPAVTDLKLWLKAHPGNGTAWAVLGLGEFAMRDFDNALIHLNRGESLGLTGSPDSVRTAKYTQAILCIRAGQFDRASELLASILKQNPQDEKAEYGLGLALLRRAELPQPTNEHHAQLMRTAGKIAALLQDSRYDEAFPLFKRLLDEHPSEPFLHYAYGSALLALSEFDEASAQMRAEMSVSPQSELPYIRLASIALKQHKAADAIPYSKRALLLSPQSAEAHYLLGRASMEVGDDTSAVHELEIAANLSPTSPEVHFNLAKAYSRAKMPEAAEKERATFARLNELSDMEKNRSGSQIYTGPHDANDVSTPSNPGTPKPN